MSGNAEFYTIIGTVASNILVMIIGILKIKQGQQDTQKQQETSQELILYRIKQLEKKVECQPEYSDRLTKVEVDIKNIKDDIKELKEVS